MKALTPHLSPDATQAVLHAALREVHGTGASLERWTAEPLSKRGKHPVVRYDLDARVGSTRHHYQWVGKFYERSAEARRVVTVLEEVAMSADPHLGLVFPRMVAYHVPCRLLLYTFEPGQTVVSAIGQYDGLVVPALGRALAALHATPVRRCGVTTAAAVLAGVRGRMDDLCGLFPSERAGLQQLLTTLEREMPAAPRTPVFLHGDLGPAQLRWRTGNIVVLDFDACTRGDPALDLGSLLTQLRRLTLRKPEKLPEFAALRTGLLGAYQRWSPHDPGLARRVAWYEQATLVRKIHFLMLDTTRHGEPDAIRRRQLEGRQLLEGLCAACESAESPVLSSSSTGGWERHVT